ncbi:hypothetical protein IFT59_18640 [Rhizobium sp. CFBP 8752]|uniref:hypothetical protein n=1 Tax=Rhizobium sp. CFBP 8752 TaxID=2775301 RepID=UPI001781EF42|nr:hypothetical protein [Rhizobium sp. CFBP 8752]MBD8665262.1 hypothetical protein [Rhizobium sp. CFBP 8752]
MDKILTNFKSGSKITVLVRAPGKPNADFCLTDDDLDEVIAMVRRRKGEAPPQTTSLLELMDQACDSDGKISQRYTVRQKERPERLDPRNLLDSVSLSAIISLCFVDGISDDGQKLYGNYYPTIGKHGDAISIHLTPNHFDFVISIYDKTDTVIADTGVCECNLGQRISPDCCVRLLSSIANANVKLNSSKADINPAALPNLHVTDDAVDAACEAFYFNWPKADEDKKTSTRSALRALLESFAHNAALAPQDHVTVGKHAVVKGAEWFVASSLRQADGAFDTYDQAMREATYLNCKLAIERGIIDQKIPGTYPITYRQHYEQVFGLPPAPQAKEAGSLLLKEASLPTTSRLSQLEARTSWTASGEPSTTLARDDEGEER